ncbi:MAG: PAS domain-containing protein [Promethearchaeota archaeon]
MNNKKFSEKKKKIKNSEENCRIILENANDLISIFDDKFRFEYINENVHKKLMGYTSDDLIGTKGMKLIHPDDRELVLQDFLKLIKIGEILSVSRIRHKTGKYLWTETKGKAYKDKDGKIKLLLITRDISRRMLADEKLRNSEEKYSNLFHLSNDAIFLHDLEANIIDVNQKVLDLFEYKKSEILSIKISDQWNRN